MTRPVSDGLYVSDAAGNRAYLSELPERTHYLEYLRVGTHGFRTETEHSVKEFDYSLETGISSTYTGPSSVANQWIYPT